MKRSQVIFFLPLMLILTTACSQNPLSSGMGFNVSEESSFDVDPSLNVTTVPYALLSSEQMLKSMASLTETPVNGTIMNEYNNRQAVFAAGNDLRLVTSPMLIAVANLSSVFCDETLRREINQPAAERRIFTDINFTTNVRAITNQNFSVVTGKLSRAFWGRGPSSEEMQILVQGKDAFVAALTTQEANANASSRGLMLFTCTAMLSSLDSYQF